MTRSHASQRLGSDDEQDPTKLFPHSKVPRLITISSSLATSNHACYQPSCRRRLGRCLLVERGVLAVGPKEDENLDIPTGSNDFGLHVVTSHGVPINNDTVHVIG